MRITLMEVTNIPTVYITTKAFLDVQLLMNTETAEDKEFVFLGIVTRKENIFLISDIHIPPQTNNSGAYCETDDDRFVEWIQTFNPNERKTIRMHGHSHVNMSTNPSSVDENTLKELMTTISDFFVQFIINLKGEYTLNIYDKTNNLIIEGIQLLVIDSLNNIFKYVDNKLILKTSSIDLNNKTVKNNKIDINDNLCLNIKTLKYEYTSPELATNDEKILINTDLAEEVDELLNKQIKTNNFVNSLYRDDEFYKDWGQGYYDKMGTNKKTRKQNAKSK